MVDEKKTELHFAIFILVAFLVMLVNLTNSFLDANLGFGDSTGYVYKFLFKLKNHKYLGDPIINKSISLVLIMIGLALNNQKKRIIKKATKEALKSSLIISIIVGALYMSHHYITETIPFLNIFFSLLTFLIFVTYFAKFSQLINLNLMKDRFTKEARKFDQTQELMENEYSVNLKSERGYVNVINPFRACAVIGTPGSGKTFVFLLEAIKQHIKKGFSMFVYDFKFPELTKFAYNCFLQYKHLYPVEPKFCIINFDDPEYTHRCNPLQPDTLTDFVDAVQSSKTILMGINKSWIQKEGDFFIESPINFLAICIWALKIDNNGDYCSLPHVIELISKDYDTLFNYLKYVSDRYDDAAIKNVAAPFISAFEKGATDQLEGQIASVRLGLSRLTSPIIYYVMTTGKHENENISLQINDPKKPMILCIGNNNDRKDVYGPCLSLYTARMIRLINRPNMNKSALIFDELPTLSFPPGTLDNLIATARSNKIATWLGFQDIQQVVRDFGEKVAKALINTIGNVFSGMVTGDTAKAVSEKFGKIKVEKNSYSVSKGVVTESVSEEMQETITPSDLSTMAQGVFAGVVSDNFGEEIDQKAFYSKIEIDLEERKILEMYDIPKIFDFKANGLDGQKVVKDVFDKVRRDITILTS